MDVGAIPIVKREIVKSRIHFELQVGNFYL
jgi:hypothetical protein